MHLYFLQTCSSRLCFLNWTTTSALRRLSSCESNDIWGIEIISKFKTVISIGGKSGGTWEHFSQKISEVAEHFLGGKYHIIPLSLKKSKNKKLKILRWQKIFWGGNISLYLCHEINLFFIWGDRKFSGWKYHIIPLSLKKSKNKNEKTKNNRTRTTGKRKWKTKIK